MTETDNDKRRAEAARWFVALDGRQLSPEEQESYSVWLKDPNNSHALAEIRHSCMAWDSMSTEVDPPKSMTRRGLFAGSGITAVALGLGIAGGPLGGYRLLFPKSVGPQNIAGTHQGTIMTGIGEQRSVLLNDDSRVNLNVSTALAYRIAPDARFVDLQNGEAQFIVSSDDRRPFTVTTQRHRLQTSQAVFNVRNRFQAGEISVSEGTVSLSATGEALRSEAANRMQIISAGEVVHYTGSEVSPPRSTPIQSIGQWQNHIIVFDDVPLQDVLREIELYFPNRISLLEPELNQQRITLRLQVSDLNATLTSLSALLSLDVSRTNDGIFLRRKEIRG